jgi:hypothetical protein
LLAATTLPELVEGAEADPPFAVGVDEALVTDLSDIYISF